MPTIDGLDPNVQWLLTTVFIISVAVFTGWSHVFGKRQPKQKSAEFSVSGQLADMGPVKELVEQTGLLVQQQVRTNLALERCAVAMENATSAYKGQIAHQATQEEVEKLAQQLFERRLSAERPKPRRRASRPTTQAK
jgi:hypothetical protein